KALLAWMLAGPCHWHGLICGAIGSIIGRLPYFPLASIFLELLLHDATAYLVGPDPYLLLGAALGQSGLLVYLAGRGVPLPLLGNLAGPALYTLVEVLLEGVEFFSAPHLQAYWVFALVVGVLQQLRLGSPAQHWARILLVSENLVRTSILLVLYVILEHQLGAYDSVWQFFEERSHIYVALVIPVIGVVVGFSQWTAHNHLQGVLATSALLQRYSEWFLGRELLERAVTDPHSLALKRRNRALLFLDIRGFTAWSERHEPEQVVTLINRFYQCAEPFWRRAQAIKVKLSADEVMLVFADPEGAAEAAREVMAACERLLRRGGLRCGAGLHWGAVVEGMIGARGHQGYDLLGDAVNTAKRLCDAAEGGGSWSRGAYASVWAGASDWARPASCA
ncbi:MAG: adenylate/guanylate cyclase domain-containing protein, partial [Candidatus Sedimenticola endophacoides]